VHRSRSLSVSRDAYFELDRSLLCVNRSLLCIDLGLYL